MAQSAKRGQRPPLEPDPLGWVSVIVFACALLFGSVCSWAQNADPPLAPQIVSPPRTTLPQGSSISPADWVSIKEFILAIIAERDRQYAQRFEAQQHAVDAALIAQDKATAAAFQAAEKAVAAALASQEKATAAAFAAANTAVAKADAANEKRLDSVNEFRAQLKDQANTFITKSEVDVRFKAVADKMDGLLAGMSVSQGRQEGASTQLVLIIALIGAGTGVVMTLLALRRQPMAVQPTVQYVPAPVAPVSNGAPAPIVAPRA